MLDSFHGGSVAVSNSRWRYCEFPWPPEEVMLLVCFDGCVKVLRPGQMVGDVYTWDLELLAIITLVPLLQTGAYASL